MSGGFRMKKFMYLFALLFVLIASQSVLAEFEVSIEGVNTTILPFESAKYIMTLENTGSTPEVINIMADANSWILSPQTVVVGVNETVTKELIITPRSGVSLSNYRIPLTFESSKSGQIETTSVVLSLSLDMYHKGYPPNVDMRVTADERVDPREPYTIKVYLKNNNLRDINKLEVSITSDLFSKEFSTPLRPLAPLSKEFVFEFDPLTKPGTHDVAILARDSETDTIVAEDYSVFTIEGYGKIISSREITRRQLFKTTEMLTFNHTGNERKSQVFTYALGNFESWFTSSDPEGRLQKSSDGGKELVWTITLDPEESTRVEITRNYRSVAAIVIIILLSIIAYFIFRKPIVAYKEAHVTAADKEGVSQMKVRLYIRNRSRKSVTNIKIIDRVPSIVEYVSHAHLGSLQPTKVTRTEKKGTILRWEIDSLEPFEERIITYKIRSKLKIVGKMSLPEAKIKFDAFGGKERITTTGIGEITKRRK